MTTLIQFRHKDGRLAGRCDAKCYNAKGLKCKCICGGRNHGVGINQAIHNTYDYKHWLEDAQDAGEFIIRPGQLKLFMEGKP